MSDKEEIKYNVDEAEKEQFASVYKYSHKKRSCGLLSMELILSFVMLVYLLDDREYMIPAILYVVSIITGLIMLYKDKINYCQIIIYVLNVLLVIIYILVLWDPLDYIHYTLGMKNGTVQVIGTLGGLGLVLNTKILYDISRNKRNKELETNTDWFYEKWFNKTGRYFIKVLSVSFLIKVY